MLRFTMSMGERVPRRLAREPAARLAIRLVTCATEAPVSSWLAVLSAVNRQPDATGPTPEHGSHTLRVWTGMIVGLNGNDVFVELGPRMQGVVARRQFEVDPVAGEEYEFTVLGQEDGLWALARVEEGLLDSWTSMETGSWVNARVTGRNPGGLELKVGAAARVHAQVRDRAGP